MSFSGASSGSKKSISHEIDSHFFGPTVDSLSHLHLIILNYTLPDYTPHLWTRCRLKVFADGGANRFYDLLPKLDMQENAYLLRSRYLPNAICGDLDSLRSNVRHFYESQGVEIRDLSYDQDSTDTDKCISYLKEQLVETSRRETILILGSLGGRLDHTLANLNSLHRYPDLDIAMIGEGNCARLIKEGRTKIQVDSEVEGQKCAIVPLNGSVRVTATGLKYPLNDHQLEFSGLISVCNSLISDVVVIQTSGPVIWITTLNDDLILERLKKPL